MDFTPNSWQDLAALLSVLGVLLLALDWRIGVKVRARTDELKTELKAELTMLTQPIQPGYRNGGHSLADVAELLKQVKALVGGDE